MTNEQLWHAVLGEIELNISRANFSTWFKNTFIASYDETKIIIGVPSAFVKTWMEGKFQKDINSSLERILNTKIKEIIFKVDSQKNFAAQQFQTNNQQPKPNQTNQNQAVAPVSISKSNGLNIKYTFQSFIKGSGNDLAYAASQAVTRNPGKAYNPLFIYGGVGLGKTHLLQAIGNELAQQDHKVLYSTCETFTNEYLGMLRSGQAKEFKQKYRGVDVLIVDDIQFMGGKEGTQQEFFHTFNQLYNTDKQIIIASDRPPKAIPALEQRLLSRFECGMIADVVQPDNDTKVAILNTKCVEKNFLIEEHLLYKIVSGVYNNIRELEGMLNRIIAHHQFNNIDPTEESIDSILNNFLSTIQSKTKNPKTIVQIVSKYYEVSHEDIIGKCRKKELVIPRQVIMYLLREECGSSYPTIGDTLGGRDHTTAMHACNKIATHIKSNIKIQHDINSIKQLIREGMTV